MYFSLKGNFFLSVQSPFPGVHEVRGLSYLTTPTPTHTHTCAHVHEHTRARTPKSPAEALPVSTTKQSHTLSKVTAMPMVYCVLSGTFSTAAVPGFTLFQMRLR